MDPLAKLMKEASPGDTVVVTRLDRLARSTRDLLNLLDRLGKDNIGFKSLRETSVDTTSPQGLVVNILASISEFERELIQARMTEGRKRAVANGGEVRAKVQAQFISATGSTRPSGSR
jgi:DNA invertase Pin-like site-specific DNA recombinase